ncbi:MAG: paraquat-inducible protein A [Thermodesulfobacteriota bacterium]|nr:MAG: paraquat-inducible protein A [Thermodesulfobacteriota bacterium]
MTRLAENLVACPECDLLQRIPALPHGGRARCPRCGHTIAASKPYSLERTLAFAVAAAIVLIVANAPTLMELSVAGRKASTTILGGAIEMWLRGQQITAMIVIFCTVVAPAVYIGIMFTVLLSARRTPAPWWIGRLLRWSEWHQSWAMVEVMMLGILVALIKIAELATVTPGIGMFAAGTLVVLVAAMTVSFDPHEVWQRVEWANGEMPDLVSGGSSTVTAESASKSADVLTGIKLGLVSCEACGLLSRPFDINEPGQCPRCGEELALRRNNSIQRTWALIIAALICYIPANVLPVMVSTTLGSSEDDTILSGVVLLYKTGSWHLALIVLIASVMIPLAKIMALAYLLITVQLRSIEGRQERLRLYRLVEFVGRWSMLDVFVVTFTVALIQLQPLMSIKPGAGVLFFAAVVILTMIAAECFDPRTIWDSSN